MGTFKEKYHSIEESEGEMYEDVLAFLLKNNLDKKLVFSVLLSVSEGFTNALEHGNKYDANKMIHIHLKVNNTAVYADIIDEGEGAIKAIDSRKPSNELEEGGRGVDLIDHYADEVTLENDKDTGGLRLSLKFYRSRYSQKILEKT